MTWHVISKKKCSSLPSLKLRCCLDNFWYSIISAWRYPCLNAQMTRNTVSFTVVYVFLSIIVLGAYPLWFILSIHGKICIHSDFSQQEVHRYLKSYFNLQGHSFICGKICSVNALNETWDVKKCNLLRAISETFDSIREMENVRCNCNRW